MEGISDFKMTFVRVAFFLFTVLQLFWVYPYGAGTGTGTGTYAWFVTVRCSGCNFNEMGAPTYN
jgi:hypothetical protein